MEKETEQQIIKMIGEEGEEILMRLEEVVNIANQDYALLTVVKEDTLPSEGNDESDEVIIMKMTKTEEDCIFEIIEDDDEFNFVAQAIADSDEIDEE